jgi:purine-binding chemotaxis protein CheW
MEKQLVIFQLCTEFFGVNIADIESIIKLQAITRVPHTSDHIEGITNLRGTILPVIDLRKRLGMPCAELTKDSRIIVVSLHDLQAGLIVDAVSEVFTITDEMVEPAPPLVTQVDSSMVTGIAKVGISKDEQRLVILLDMDEVLATAEHLEAVA